MNRELLLQLQARHDRRLTELRGRLERNEVREADIDAVQEEIEGLIDELQGIKDELADDGGDGSDGTGDENRSGGSGDEGGSGDDTNENRDGGGNEGDGGENRGSNPPTAGSLENREGMISQQQRDGLMGSISQGLQARGRMNAEHQEQQVRRAFAQYIVGQIDEHEARSLGVEINNGAVTVPTVIAADVITYAQEENPLRRLGEVVHTAGNVKYPFLVKKAEANVSKKERTSDMPETDMEFDEILLDPAEFDALATVTKKLIKMSGAPIEDIVVNELKKAYVRKEANYMFNGDDSGNENSGALAKKAVAFSPAIPVDLTAADAGQKMYDALIDLKNAPVTEVMKKGRFLINRAALKVIEKMKTTDGTPLLRPLTQVENGIGNLLVGYPVEVSDYVDKKGSPDLPVFYFGDFYSFKIQDIDGAMEIQKLIEKFAGKNRVGFQIYNLLDGQLIYSPIEPTVYRYEVAPVTP